MIHEDPKDFYEVIQRGVVSKVAPVNSFERLVASSKPSTSSCESKWNANDSINFQKSYELACNKSQYLQSLSKDKKPSLDEQYEALSLMC